MSSGKEYSLLAVSMCQTVEERVRAEDKRRAGKKSFTSVAKKLIAGAFKLRRLPSSCYAPRKTDEFGNFEHHPEEDQYCRNNVGRSSSVKYPPRHLQAKVLDLYSPNTTAVQTRSMEDGFEVVDMGPLIGGLGWVNVLIFAWPSLHRDAPVTYLAITGHIFGSNLDHLLYWSLPSFGNYPKGTTYIFSFKAGRVRVWAWGSK